MANELSESFQFSDSWQVPTELRSPTASVVSNLVIIMLSSEMLGNDLISMVGELQTEDARFNKWCGSVGKCSLEMSDVSRRNREARSLIRRVYEAWASFSETFEAGRRKRSVAVAERSDLKTALTEAIRGLAALREPSP